MCYIMFQRIIHATMGNSLFWNTVGSERMNGVRAGDRRNLYMHVYVVAYPITCTLTSLTISISIYRFVPNVVIILKSVWMPV